MDGVFILPNFEFNVTKIYFATTKYTKRDLTLEFVLDDTKFEIA
jgi:hypothetical protein